MTINLSLQWWGTLWHSGRSLDTFIINPCWYYYKLLVQTVNKTTVMVFQIVLHFLLLLGFFRLCRGENRHNSSEQFKTYTLHLTVLKIFLIICWKFTLENTTERGRWVNCDKLDSHCWCALANDTSLTAAAPAVPGRSWRSDFVSLALGTHLPLLLCWAGQVHPASVSCGDRWLPGLSGWHPSASSGQAPAAASATQGKNSL